MKKYLLITSLLLVGFFGIAQQRVNKASYQIINPNFDFILKYEKALSHTQLDGLRFMNQRRQIPIEGTNVKIELYSAQELLINYGKTISPLTIKNPNNAQNNTLKLSDDYYNLIIQNFKENEYRNIENIRPTNESITNFGVVISSGDVTGIYSNNENYSKTIYSDNGEKPYLNFTSFSTENNFDVLYIYDGADASARLIGSYTGGNSPKIIQATGAYLTVVFTSDNSITSTGWNALVGRGAPPLPPSTMSAPNCGSADPFCTGTTYTFPATTGSSTGEAGPSYGCLYSQPNPAWYYLQIANSGNLTLNIAGSGGGDVDFICWGPFTSPTAPCTTGLTGACSGNHACSGNIVDCSYSASATENCTIPTAVTGQYYMVMITNFSNQTQNIVFNQTGGSGSTNCSIVAPCTLTASNTGPYCVGQTISIAATSTATGTYSWQGPGGYTASGQNPIRTGAAAAMSGTYTATLVSGTSTCTATTIVTVNSPPAVSVTSASVCAGGSASLTASGATTYSWTPATNLSGTTGSSVTANPASTTVYSVTGTTSGCSATATATLTVVPIPTITVNAQTVCAGSSATFTANGASTYAWSPPTGLSATTGSVVTSTSTSGITYTVTGTTSGCSKTNTAVLTVNPSPTVTVNSPSVCAGGAVTITASGATTYSWSNGMTGTSISVTPTVTTSYTVTGTSLGCTGTAVSTVSVTNIPKLIVNDATICPGGTATLSASGATTYTWSTSANTSSISVSPGSTQTYSVTGSIGGCLSSTLSVVTVGSGVSISVPSATICTGDVVTLTATGATSYVWSPSTGLSSTSGSSVSANPTNTQTYVITGTSGVCTGTTTAVVTVNPTPTVTVPSAIICVGNSTTLTASGASTYIWSPATGLSSTTGYSVTANPTSTQGYTITGTSALGCTNTATAVVTVNPLPIVTVNSPTICTGNAASLTASGASTYVWSTGATTAGISVSPMVTQVYTVTGTTSSCTSTATSTVTVVTTPTITVASATICTGSSTSLTASGASTYVWSPATGLSATTGSTVTANPTGTITYNIIGTAGTCTASATAVVTVNPLPIVSVITPTICSGSASLLTASGASSYSWSTGATNTNTVSVSPAGNTNYTVTGTDANGCVSSAVGTVSVSASVTVAVNDPIICTGFTTTLTATGATSYSWSTGATVQTITVSPTVTTSYTVTGSQNGCFGTEYGTVTVVTNPTITVSSATVCVGGSTTLTAGGASHYVWTPATGLSSTTTATVTANPTSTTTYTVVGSAGTCTATSTGVLTVNPLPTITATSGTICVGQQTATLTASGGVSYSWSPAGSLSPATGTPVVASPSVTQNYTVTGADANGCVNTGTTQVTVNPLPTITATSGTICVGQQTVTITASGGTSYVWSPSTGLSGTTSASEAANPGATQNYTITGTDANGCVNTGTASVVVNSLPNVTATSTSICPTFAGTISASGANTYTWSTGFVGANLTQTPIVTTNYTVNGTDFNTCTNTAVGTINVFPTLTVTVNSSAICIGQQTTTLTASGAVIYSWNPAVGLSSPIGSSVTAMPNTTTIYTVTGTVGSCSATAISTVTVNQLPTITVTSGVICIGEQTATLIASGGVTYTWTPATGLGGITGSSVTGNPTSTQTYVVTGTDANGCTNTASTIISVLQLPTVTATSTSVCPGAAGTLLAGGATTYSWTSPAVIGSTLNQTPTNTTTYSVTGTDTHGCYNTATGTITVYNTFAISVNSATICAAGQQTATLTATGANTYIWSPIAGISSNTGSSVTTIPSAVSNVYTITGTSAVGSCTATTTASLTVNALPLPVASSNRPCANQQALTFSCTPSGLSSYNWAGNNYNAVGQNPTVPISGVTTALSGIYTVTVVDNNIPGCTNTSTVNVVINPLPIATASVAPVCIGQTINLTASGGVSYSWTQSAGSFTTSVQNPQIPLATLAMAGNYFVIVTDGYGCVAGNVATATVNPLPVITATANAICLGQQTSTLTASGGLTYTWTGSYLSSTSTNPTMANPVVSTFYNVSGTDINNCVNTTKVLVVVNTLPKVTINPINPDCVPYCPKFVTVNTSSTSTISTYNWNFGNGASSAIASPIQCFTVSGTSTVLLTVTDINGCVNTATTSVTTFPIPMAQFTYGEQPVSVLAPEVHFNNQSTPGLNYSWNFGDVYNNLDSTINPTHIYNNVGYYTVTLTASTDNGCSATTHNVIQIFDDYALYVPNAFSPNSDGKNEIFKPVGEGITDYKLFIFDRWGSLIFFSDDIDKGWDGTYQAKGTDILQQDVYVWKIQVKNVKSESKDLTGTVTLLK